jgi:hypothetical protein
VSEATLSAGSASLSVHPDLTGFGSKLGKDAETEMNGALVAADAVDELRARRSERLRADLLPVRGILPTAGTRSGRATNRSLVERN